MKFNFNFQKDRYDYELKRKDQITAALTLPVGILIALGAAIAAMARSFSYTDGYLKWFFLTLSKLGWRRLFTLCGLPRTCLPSANVLVSTAVE